MTRINIRNIQVGDRVWDAGTNAHSVVVERTLLRDGVQLTFSDLLSSPIKFPLDLIMEVERPAPEEVQAHVDALEAAGVVITGKSLLDNVLQPKPELDYAKAVTEAEAALNRAIQALPANMYVLVTVQHEDIGRKRKMPFITVTPCQEAGESA